MPRIIRRRQRSRREDSGYMLLVLMLAVAVLMITMLGVARNYRRSILRDREVEMIHRGEQYERAVKRYYHKFGNYPASIEQLENTNKVRFLRKKYKDPMSPDGAWKLVHQTDVTLKAGGGLMPTSDAGGSGGSQTNPLQPNAGGSGGTTNGTPQSTGSQRDGNLQQRHEQSSPGSRRQHRRNNWRHDERPLAGPRAAPWVEPRAPPARLEAAATATIPCSAAARCWAW